MTENEAIKHLELCKKSRMFIPNNDVLEVAIQALEEIQQYRAIGTVEDIQSMKDNGAFSGVELAQIAAMQMKLKDYQSIGTIEEFKALKEKNEPKKPLCVSMAKDKDKNVGNIGRCPCCNDIVSEDMLRCDECGQKLDWN